MKESYIPLSSLPQIVKRIKAGVGSGGGIAEASDADVAMILSQLGDIPTVTFPLATTYQDGLMSRTDKARIDNLSVGTRMSITDTNAPKIKCSIMENGTVKLSGHEDLIAKGNTVHLFRWCRGKNSYRPKNGNKYLQTRYGWLHYGKYVYDLDNEGYICHNDNLRSRMDLRDLVYQGHNKDYVYGMGSSMASVRLSYDITINGVKTQLVRERTLTFRIGIAIGPNETRDTEPWYITDMLSKVVVLRISVSPQGVKTLKYG